MGDVVRCCPQCGHLGTKAEPHEDVRMQIVDMTDKDFAEFPSRCGGCRERFFGFIHRNGVTQNNMFKDGKPWLSEAALKHLNPEPKQKTLAEVLMDFIKTMRTIP